MSRQRLFSCFAACTILLGGDLAGQVTSTQPAASPELNSLVEELSAGQEAAVAAMTRLSELGDAAAPVIPALIGLLDKDKVWFEVQKRAISYRPAVCAASVLIRIGEPAIPAVTSALDRDGTSLPANAAYVLGAIRSSKTIPGLERALSHADAEVRMLAARGLGGHYSQAEARALLLGALQDKDQSVREAATFALRLHEEPRRPGTPRIPSNFERAKIVQALAAALSDAEPSVRINAAEAIATYGDGNSVVPLTKALGDPDRLVRAIVAQALGKIGDRRATAPLVDQLERETDSTAIALLCQALGALKDPLASRPLTRLLAHEKSSIRLHAARGLRGIADRTTVEALVKALDDEDDDVRAEVAWALGETGDDRAVDPLVAYLKSNRGERSRTAAAQALGKLGDPRTIPVLVSLVYDEKAGAQDAAAESLLSIRSAAVVFELANDPRAATGGYGPHLARRTVGKLTGSDHAWSSESFAAWWAENKQRYSQ
jgi:HEAT repeat protein